MKSITRLPLALIVFSFFSISYLVTEVSALDCADPTNATMPECAHGGMQGGNSSSNDSKCASNERYSERDHYCVPK